jgi:hypothetical protein
LSCALSGGSFLLFGYSCSLPAEPLSIRSTLSSLVVLELRRGRVSLVIVCSGAAKTLS